jgi:hypothetical protein
MFIFFYLFMYVQYIIGMRVIVLILPIIDLPGGKKALSLSRPLPLSSPLSLPPSHHIQPAPAPQPPSSEAGFADLLRICGICIFVYIVHSLEVYFCLCYFLKFF